MIGGWSSRKAVIAPGLRPPGTSAINGKGPGKCAHNTPSSLERGLWVKNAPLPHTCTTDPSGARCTFNEL